MEVLIFEVIIVFEVVVEWCISFIGGVEVEFLFFIFDEIVL